MISLILFIRMHIWQKQQWGERYDCEKLKGVEAGQRRAAVDPVFWEQHL